MKNFNLDQEYFKKEQNKGIAKTSPFARFMIISGWIFGTILFFNIMMFLLLKGWIVPGVCLTLFSLIAYRLIKK